MIYQYNELLNYVKKHEDEFRRYFEAILYPDGTIELARPSHQETLIRYFFKKEGISSKEELLERIPLSYSINNYIVDKYKCVSIWYNYIVYSSSGLTPIQEDILKNMEKDGLISKFANYTETHEYQHYLHFYKNREELIGNE